MRELQEIENCLLCNKFLPTIALQEQSFCNNCDDELKELKVDFNKLSIDDD